MKQNEQKSLPASSEFFIVSVVAPIKHRLYNNVYYTVNSILMSTLLTILSKT